MKSKKHIFVLIIIVFGLGGITDQIFFQGTDTVTGPKNATYAIEGQKITLTNGIFEEAAAPGSASKITTRYFGNEAVGNLDENKKDDLAFLLVQETAGTGIFYFITAFLNRETGTNVLFLGDRIAPQTTEIKDGMIVVNYADRAPGEPMAAEPSVGVSKYFKITNGMLEEVKQ